MKFKLYGLLVVVFFLGGCASSKIYKPPSHVKTHFANSIKNVMPSDVLSSPETYKDKEIHWIGILKDVSYENDNLALLTLEQKYWDYIEDNSIQTEKIFLSPKGDGGFMLLFPIKDKDKFEVFIQDAVAREDLMFVYGEFKEVKKNLPVLKFTNGSFIHERFYSTKIMEYDIVRDDKGNILVNNIGVPQTKNSKLLRIPKAGEND